MLSVPLDEICILITNVGELDREESSEWELEVTASDGAPFHPRSTAVSLRVDVEDVNDNAPAILNPQRQIYIPDNLKEGPAIS